jgi:hypothetical protein
VFEAGVVTRQLLASLADLPRLKGVGFSDIEFAADVDTLRLPPSVTSISFFRVRFRDGLFAARSAPDLEIITLRECRNVDAVLPALAGINSLRVLGLTTSDVSPKGFASLAGCPLESVYLPGTQVGDESVPTLLSMKGLRTVLCDVAMFSAESRRRLEARRIDVQS